MSPFYFVFTIFLVDFGDCRSYVENKRRELSESSNQGQPLSITDAPYLATYNLPLIGPFCGATIVHQRFLVTAAECVDWFLSAFAYINVGTDKMSGGERYEIESTFIHPDYDIETLDKNIAVIKLRENLVFSDRVQPISLAPSNMEFKAGNIMMSMGIDLSQIHIGSLHSVQVLKFEVPYVSQDVCNKQYEEIIESNFFSILDEEYDDEEEHDDEEEYYFEGEYDDNEEHDVDKEYNYEDENDNEEENYEQYDDDENFNRNKIISDKMICTSGKRGICAGDMGAPLIYNNSLVGVGVGIGVLTFGVDCGALPDVYARVPALRDFVDSTINNNL